MSLTALRKLVESSKATVLVGVVAAMAVLVYLGKLDAQQMIDTIKILVPGWMLAHAGETGAKHIANGRIASPVSVPGFSVVDDSEAVTETITNAEAVSSPGEE